MKKFLDTVTEFFASLARARSAASMAKMYRYEEAAAEMTKK